MKSVVVWIRQSKKQEVELSFERDALRIYPLPSLGAGPVSNNSSSSKIAETTNEPAPLATIYFADIVGCHRMKGRSSDDRSSYFTVYAYPFHGSHESNGNIHEHLRTSYSTRDNLHYGYDEHSNGNHPKDHNLVKKSGRRERRCYTFQIHGKYVYEDNAAYVKNWVDAIRARIVDIEPPHIQSAGLLRDIQCRQRRLYVLVNPHSGPGRALEIFQNRVMPVFAEANIACRLIVTERANHAQELVRDLNSYEWDGIVIVSGDGLLYEVINGLANRSDRDQALNIPIGAIPGGSGNALAAATCLGPNEVIKGDFAVDAAVMVSRPIYQKMRLIRVEMRNHNIWSFISVGWGLLSDIDIESEKFRRTLGSARFTAGACIRVLNLRKYRARISYVPADDNPEIRLANVTAVQNGYSKTRSVASERDQVASSKFDTEHENERSACNSVQRAKSLSPNNDAARSLDDLEDANNVDLIAATPTSESSLSPFQVRFDLELSSTVPSTTVSPSVPPSTRLTPSVPSSTRLTLDDHRKGDIVPMPSIDEAVPGDWKVIEDEFILFYAVYLNHIGSEAPYMPCSRFDDQCIYITFIRTSAVTRHQLVKFLFALEHAEHWKMPFFEIIPAKAFRLDRLSIGQSDIVAVDGELIRDVEGPIQACVSNYAATVMTVR